MKRIRDHKFAGIPLYLLIFFTINGCALLIGSDEDPTKKNTAIQFEAPTAPYSKLNVSSADTVWQSSDTGNTIAINSTCQKKEEKDLNALEKNILLGVDHLNILSEQTQKYNGEDARRVVAEGKTEGIPIQADILILEKNKCTYDLAYIARKKTYDTEHVVFENFLTKFRAP